MNVPEDASGLSPYEKEAPMKMDREAGTVQGPPQVMHDVIHSTAEGASDVLADALSAQNRQLDRQVKAALEARATEANDRQLPQPENYPIWRLEKELKELVRGCGYDGEGLDIAPPPPNVQGTEQTDLAFNVGSLAKQSRQPLPAVTQAITDAVRQHPLVAHVQVIGPFINISLDFQKLAPEVLGQVRELGADFGKYNEGNGRVVVLDYSGPNIAKNMTVAHLRSTIIGHSLSKIYAATGYTAFRINHLGDWGTQFGKIIYQYRRELEKDGDQFLARLNENPAAVLLEIYRKFVANEEHAPEAVEEARSLFLKLEQGDPELVALWSRFREWSLQEFANVYERLGIEFDALQGESFYEDHMSGVVEEGMQRGVLRRNEEGAVVFPGQPLTDPATLRVTDKLMKGLADPKESKSKEMVWRDEIIIKPNGGTVYLTRDLAAIRYRSQELGAAKILYIIGKEQKKHCAMLMNMAAQMGWNEIGQSQHLSFGHLNVDGRKMKSREGKVVLLNDVLNEAIEAARGMLLERKAAGGDSSPLTPEQEEVARKVGVGAIIYNDLKQDRERDIEFSPDAARTIEAGQCPYIQYTYCRLRSISEKADFAGDANAVPAELTPEERGMILELAMFPCAIEDAARSNTPHKIANYLDHLSQRVNNFYHSHDVTKADEKTRAFRLALVECSRQVLLNAGDLLHIEFPERM